MPLTLPTSTSGIYKILCVPTGKFYIGSSQNVRHRCRRHCWELAAGNHHSRRLQSAWNKHGVSVFVFSLVEVAAESDLLVREQYWLDLTNCYDPGIGYNMARCTEAPGRGYKHSSETLAKMSKANKGRKHTPEARRNMAAGSRGRTISPEGRKKLSVARTGMTFTAEHRFNQSAAAIIRWEVPGARERGSEAQKKRYQAPGARERQAEAMKGRKPSPPVSLETRAKMSVSHVARHAARKQQEAANV